MVYSYLLCPIPGLLWRINVCIQRDYQTFQGNSDENVTWGLNILERLIIGNCFTSLLLYFAAQKHLSLGLGNTWVERWARATSTSLLLSAVWEDNAPRHTYRKIDVTCQVFKITWQTLSSWQGLCHLAEWQVEGSNSNAGKMDQTWSLCHSHQWQGNTREKLHHLAALKSFRHRDKSGWSWVEWKLLFPQSNDSAT